MVERKEYLKILRNFKDKEVIKVVTGIRRCGKSTLLNQFKNEMLESNIQENQIISLNLEDYDYDFIKTAKDLHEYIKEKLNADKMNYIFIDEVQMIPEFQKAIDSLYIKKNCDIYITWSNALLLSSELATLLSGRYIEIKMLPLSFKEYSEISEDTLGMQDVYFNYITKSSFPYVINLQNDEDIKIYLDSIIDSVFIKDIMARGKYPDIQMLKSVLNYTFDNIR